LDDLSDGGSDHESEESAQVLPIAMAERLRAARAELEAEFESEAAFDGPAGDSPESVAEAGDEESPAADEAGPGRKRARETRYARQSAKLPRLTEAPSEDAEGLSSMAGFRARMLRSKSKSGD
jgi:hypothetical protein